MKEETITAVLGKVAQLKRAIQQRIIGQEGIIDQLLIAFMAGGHALLEGVPGLAKTLMIRTLSEACAVDFQRIQFTPDLMPSDIIGTEILQQNPQTGERSFRFKRGPIFTNILLADEINRTPPKTQAALLEAMQEYAVTYGGQRYALPRPFFLLATQNPIEQSGTFPLPEAQLDRFLLYIQLGYPGEEEEFQILQSTTGTTAIVVKPVIQGAEIMQLQQLVREVHINEELIRYVSRVVRGTRPADTTLPFIQEWVQWGAGPRAGQAMIICAKAAALIEGRFAVTPADIAKVAYPVLRHRILLNFKAEAEAKSVDWITEQLLRAIPLPKPQLP
ncbi:MAG: MoxR family ATPase [Bacteroidota bacterium]